MITQNNLSVGGTLSINNITAAAQHSLQAVTNVGNVTSNTVQFSNAITSLVASSNIVATGNVSAGRDTDTTSYFGRAAVGYMGTSDQASFAHFDRNSSAQYALKQTAAGPTYINTPASGHIRFTVNDGNAGAEKMRITSAGNVGIGVSAPHANLHVEGNVYVSSNLTVSGNVEVGGSILGYATKISVTSPSGTESSFAYGSENYKLHTFTSDGTFTVTASGIVEYLIVAGGGGGGYGHTGGGGHGGGGGGGVLTGTMWVPVGNHAVTVGDGGAGDSSNSSGNGANGGNSTFLHQIAIGGGGGHGWANTPLTGNSGGCGGGGGGVSTGSGGGVGGYGTMNQGCNGGDGHYDDGSNNNHTGHRGGGGGGAGTPGRSWHVNLHRNNWKAFEGGDGRACSITGSQVYYGGGGGGSGIVSSYLYAIVTASGGLGGGGNGGISNSGSNAGNTAGGNGTTNTGGGGGGGGYARDGGAGGSGIVIIRYLI